MRSGMWVALTAAFGGWHLRVQGRALQRLIPSLRGCLSAACPAASARWLSTWPWLHAQSLCNSVPAPLILPLLLGCCLAAFGLAHSS